jgi:hypothetical protein
MADVKVRNKKTGEEKILPSKVAEMLKNVYTIIGDAPVKPVVKSEPVEIKPVQTLQEATEPKKKEEVTVADVKNDSRETIVNPQGPKDRDDLETLRLEYEQKLGKKPHGKMGVESLKKAIENA